MHHMLLKIQNHTTQSTINQRKSMDPNCPDATAPNSSKWHSECNSFFFFYPQWLHQLKKYSTRYAHPKYNQMLWVCTHCKSKRKSKQDEESLKHINRANLKELELQGALSLWTVVITSEWDRHSFILQLLFYGETCEADCKMQTFHGT